MKRRNRILGYVQLSLQGLGIASLGTLHIFNPDMGTLLFGSISLLGGLLICIMNKEV